MLMFYTFEMKKNKSSGDAFFWRHQRAPVKFSASSTRMQARRNTVRGISAKHYTELHLEIRLPFSSPFVDSRHAVGWWVKVELNLGVVTVFIVKSIHASAINRVCGGDVSRGRRLEWRRRRLKSNCCETEAKQHRCEGMSWYVWGVSTTITC